MTEIGVTEDTPEYFDLEEGSKCMTEVGLDCFVLENQLQLKNRTY